MTDNEMLILGEAIRKKYEVYRLAKPGKYPLLKFNSYPAPYEHLRTSFQEELTSYGRADMKEALATIPSIKVFAKVFYEGYIIRDENVLNTCYLYAWGKPRNVVHDAVSMPVAPDILQPTDTDGLSTNRVYARNLPWATLAIVIGLLIYVAIDQYRSTLHPSGLLISSPTNGMTVPRIMIAEGKTAHAEVVWIVIRSIEWPEYYVQSPIKVANDGTWKGPIYTGNLDKRCIGLRFHIRAFVNPVKPILEEQILYAWPEAELSSDIIEVVRGAQNIQLPTP